MNHFLIVSLSRSGGKLLRMLLDGHPALNVFPFEHWNRASKKKIPARRMEIFASLSVDDKLATAGAPHVERKLVRVHPDTLVANVLRTWREAAAGANSLPAMYEALARAYFAAVGGPPDAGVVNHCGSLCRFSRDELDAVFGKGKHLLTIRDPRAVFTSMQGLLQRKFTPERLQQGQVSASELERHLEKLKPIDSASGYLTEFCVDYRHMVAEYAARPDVIRIRFEDLVTSTESTMRYVAAQLAVSYEPILLTPTERGISHSPNSSFSRRGATVHSDAADDWKARISPAARSYIEENLAEEMAALGYQRSDASGRSVLPAAPLLGNA